MADKNTCTIYMEIYIVSFFYVIRKCVILFFNVIIKKGIKKRLDDVLGVRGLKKFENRAATRLVLLIVVGYIYVQYFSCKNA